MLSEKDKRFIKGLVDNVTVELKNNQRSQINQIKIELVDIVQQELKNLVMGKVRKQKVDEHMKPTGEEKWFDVNFLHEMVSYTKGIEGAWRGTQADMDRFKSRMKQYNEIMDRCVNAVQALADMGINKKMLFVDENYVDNLIDLHNAIQIEGAKQIEGGN